MLKCYYKKALIYLFFKRFEVSNLQELKYLFCSIRLRKNNTFYLSEKGLRGMLHSYCCIKFSFDDLTLIFSFKKKTFDREYNYAI